MKSLKIDGKGHLELKNNIDIPSSQKGEALIKIIRAGICNTDVEIISGYADFEGTIGHEFVGRVEKIVLDDYNNEPSIAVNDRVVGHINITCNKCSNCILGGIFKRNHCKNRNVLGIRKKNGVFAEYITLPITNLVRVPQKLSDQQAVFAEPLGAAFRIVEQHFNNASPSRTNMKIAVIGDGKLGLLITEVLLIQEPSFEEVTIFGHHMNKMNCLPSQNNILSKHIINDEAESSLQSFTNYFDVCVEATGKPGGLETAINFTRSLGVIILKTTCSNTSLNGNLTSLNLSQVVVKELTVTGSRCGNIEMALDAMQSEKIQVDKYVTSVYSFENVLEAIKKSIEKTEIKVQLIMD